NHRQNRVSRSRYGVPNCLLFEANRGARATQYTFTPGSPKTEPEVSFHRMARGLHRVHAARRPLYPMRQATTLAGLSEGTLNQPRPCWRRGFPCLSKYLRGLAALLHNPNCQRKAYYCSGVRRCGPATEVEIGTSRRFAAPAAAVELARRPPSLA